MGSDFLGEVSFLQLGGTTDALNQSYERDDDCVAIGSLTNFLFCVAIGSLTDIVFSFFCSWEEQQMH